ncbi:hypothetical protein [Ancylobacter lacus]|uniref:hypothetical protein n=1 Tax=Ancylobacter lacus TaxID=2579970 RepID=UPI001BCE8293|nr:hypothetical protein [Ancylobacter lacus]MBS7541072.1 hypothetical protein [Ancylobacter lacus]
MAKDDPAGDSGTPETNPQTIPAGVSTPADDATPSAAEPVTDEPASALGGRKGRRRAPPTIDLAATDVTPAAPAASSAAPAAETVAGESVPPAAESVESAPSTAPDAPPAGDVPAEGTDAAGPVEAAVSPDAGPGAEAPGDSAPATPPARRSPGPLALAGLALVCGLIGGAVAFTVAGTVYDAAENAESITDVEARVVDLRQRVEAVEARPSGSATAPAGAPAAAAADPRVDEIAGTLAALDKRIAALEALGPRVAALESAPAPPPPPAEPSPELLSRLSAVEAATKQAAEAADSAGQTARSAAENAARAGDSAQQAVNEAARATGAVGAVSGIGDRVAALDSRIETLGKASEQGASEAVTQARQSHVAANGAAQLAALVALRASVRAGRPFADDLSALDTLAGGPVPELEGLRPYAGEGLPTPPMLAARLVAPAPEPAAAAADAAPSGEGFIARLQRSAENLVSVKRADQAAPAASVDESLASARNALRRGDVARATELLRAVPAPQPASVTATLAALEARSAALASLDTVNRRILATLAGRTP